MDDEPLALVRMKKLLDHLPGVEVAGSFSNARDCKEFLRMRHIDLLLADIEMASEDGISFVRKLEVKPLVIFVTAYSEYALDGFEVNAIDYLLKPVRIERLTKSIHKAEQYLSLLKQAKANARAVAIEDGLVIRANRQFVKLAFADIKYVEGLKDYVIIHTKDAVKHLTAMNIKTMLEQLPATLFVRISKSFIVNLRFVHAASSHTVVLLDHQLPLGSVYKEKFLQLFSGQKNKH